MTRTHRGRRSHEVVRRAGDMAAGPGARAGGVTCAAVVPWLVRTARSVGRRSRAEATSGAHAAKPLGSPPRRRGAHYRPRAGTAFCSWPSFCSWSPWRWRRLRGVPFSAWCSGSWLLPLGLLRLRARAEQRAPRCDALDSATRPQPPNRI